MKAKRALSRKLHPIWTGIGCAMLVLIPLISWALMEVLLEYALREYPDLGRTFAQANPGGINFLYVKIGLTVVLAVLLYLIFTILGSLLYSMLGGARDAEIASRIGTDGRR